MSKNKSFKKDRQQPIDHLKRSAYKKSYRKAKNDQDMVKLAEEGLEDYLEQIEDTSK